MVEARRNNTLECWAEPVILIVETSCGRRGEVLAKSRPAAELPADRETKKPTATLGDVLYAKPTSAMLEEDWAGLVQRVAAGDQPALHALYELAHHIVFTFVMRISANRETAEELTIDVFHDVWRRASRYDAQSGTVLGWIMNQARSRAIDRL